MEKIRRKQLIWQEDVLVKEEIHRLMCEKYGSAKQGQRTDLTSSTDDEVWSSKKTAELLQQSEGGIRQDIQLAKAIKEDQSSSGELWSILKPRSSDDQGWSIRYIKTILTTADDAVVKKDRAAEVAERWSYCKTAELLKQGLGKESYTGFSKRNPVLPKDAW